MTKSWRWLVFCAVACVSVVGIENASTQSRGSEGSSTSPVTQLQCDMQGYKPATGLNAVLQGNSLAVSWTGQDGAELRARYGVDGGTPVVRELAVRKQGGQWVSLGENLRPEYHVVSGIRRFSGQQGQPLTGLGQLTPERMEKEKWFVYRDAPLLYTLAQHHRRAGADVAVVVGPGDGDAAPAGRGGRGGDGPIGGGPKPEDIRRASSSFKTTSCSVNTDGARLEVKFNGLSMGIFDGDLQFTAYRGTNLLRMDAIAKTNEPSVAYKYDAGLSGFSTATLSRVAWNDVGGSPQQYQFGGVKNETRVPVRADNRVIVAEGRGGSLATFPPPHTFFWPRQVEVNLGYRVVQEGCRHEFRHGNSPGRTRGS